MRRSQQDIRIFFWRVSSLPEALSDSADREPMIMLSIRWWKKGVCSHCVVKKWKNWKLLLFRKLLVPLKHFHSGISLKTADFWENLPDSLWKQFGEKKIMNNDNRSGRQKQNYILSWWRDNNMSFQLCFFFFFIISVIITFSRLFKRNCDYFCTYWPIL